MPTKSKSFMGYIKRRYLSVPEVLFPSIVHVHATTYGGTIFSHGISDTSYDVMFKDKQGQPWFRGAIPARYIMKLKPHGLRGRRI